MKHLPDCAVGVELAHTTGCVHRWSGWPGAVCLDCGADDAYEVCLAGCKCQCHDAFWEAYALQEIAIEMGG